MSGWARKCQHYPSNITGRSYGPVPGHEPWKQGEYATCSRCGKAIIFIEGFALRRDYWRLASNRKERVIRVPTG